MKTKAAKGCDTARAMGNKVRPGQRYEDKNTGRIITVRQRVGSRHWNCICGKKNHKVHDGTLRRFYRLVADEN